MLRHQVIAIFNASLGTSKHVESFLGVFMFTFRSTATCFMMETKIEMRSKGVAPLRLRVATEVLSS